MALYVQKFGGSSVANIERIQQVADKVRDFHRDGHQVVVVLSAMSGDNNRLLELARQVSSNP